MPQQREPEPATHLAVGLRIVRVYSGKWCLVECVHDERVRGEVTVPHFGQVHPMCRVCKADDRMTDGFSKPVTMRMRVADSILLAETQEALF